MDGRFFSTTKRGGGLPRSHSACRSHRTTTPASALPPSRRAGEIVEFKQELGAADRGKKKDAVKKVIAGE